MDEGEPDVGDLVAISLLPEPGRERPFAIGRVLAIARGGVYVIHWYGNKERSVEGTYRPEWRSPIGQGSSQTFYTENSEEESEAYKFTTKEAGMTVKRKAIKHFGFQIQYNDRLPKSLIQKLNDDPTIKWSIFTKPLGPVKFCGLRTRIGVVDCFNAGGMSSK